MAPTISPSRTSGMPPGNTERYKAQGVERGGRDADVEKPTFDEALDLYAFLLRRCTGIGQQIVQERNAKLFEQLTKHLADVDEQSIRRDYFETPKGFDRLMKAMDESRRTRSDEKRNLIARILRGALIDGESEYSPEEYLNLISDLTPQELKVLRSAYRQRPGPGMSFRSWCLSACAVAGFDRSDFLMTLSRLNAYGLIHVVEKAPHRSRSGGLTAVREHTGFDRIERIFISPPFEKLMTFLEQDV
jgi:hypothetical protein